MSEVTGVTKIKPEYLCEPPKVLKCSEPAKTELDDVSSKVSVCSKKRKRSKPVPLFQRICPSILKTDGVCPYGESCHYSHNIQAYMASKPESLDMICVNLELHGFCPYGLCCRFKHPPHYPQQHKGIIAVCGPNTLNCVDGTLLMCLRKKKHAYPKASDVLNRLQRPPKVSGGGGSDSNSYIEREGCCSGLDYHDQVPAKSLSFSFKDKLYLAPLTTVGNLPFRRICKGFGADITCSEMVLATSLLQGKRGEWALLKRHKSEDIFGVQVAGAFPDSVAKAVELICDHASVDFIDLNLGCPIDLLYNKGAGAALMGNSKKVGKVVQAMCEVSNVPITIKLRTGLKDDHKLLGNLIPMFNKLGVSAYSIHGRSREQRYTKLADWNYINECSLLASPTPVIGNGDILSHEDICQKSTDNVTGIMIGRGALIKPWIFTEIKEKRLWDISATERLDIIGTYAKFGLEHWGTDTQGLEHTRRFLLEWLSFLYRYVPVGLLEFPPQKMNQRPEHFRGRSELETLLASPDPEDWIKISSMFLGPPDDGFVFIPKHKSNAYG